MEALKEKFKGINAYFWLSFLIFTILPCIVLPSLTTQAQLWAETGTNFFLNGLSESVVRQLAIPDAGYFVFLPRIIAIGVIKLGFTDHFVYFVQFFALVFNALFISFINLRSFRNIVPDDLTRFFVSVYLGSVLFFVHEFYVFNNFAYVGIIVLLLGLFIEKEKLTLPWLIALTLFTFLIITSKGYFIIFAPIYIIGLISCGIKKRFKSFSYYLSGCLGAFLQVISMHINQASSNMRTDAVPPDLLKVLTGTVYYYLQTFYFLLLQYHLSLPSFFQCLIAGVFLILVFYFAFKKRRSRPLLFNFLAAANVIAFLYLGITTLMIFKHSPIFAYQPPSWGGRFWFPISRHFYPAAIVLSLGIITLLIDYIKNKKIAVWLLVALSFVPIFYAIYRHKNYDVPLSKSYAQWDLYKPLLKNKEFAVPVNPYPWAMLKNCQYLNSEWDFDLSYRINFLDLDMYAPTKGWSVLAFTIDTGEENPGDITVVAYGPDRKKLPSPKVLTPSINQYRYYLFDKEVKIGRLEFFGDHNRSISIYPRLKFMGNIVK